MFSTSTSIIAGRTEHSGSSTVPIRGPAASTRLTRFPDSGSLVDCLVATVDGLGSLVSCYRTGGSSSIAFLPKFQVVFVDLAN